MGFPQICFFDIITTPISGVCEGSESMPVTQKELEQTQNEWLFDLLKIKAAMKEGVENAALKDAICRAKSVMTEEQIAWVEKNVNASL